MKQREPIDFSYKMPSGANAGKTVAEVFLQQIDCSPEVCWHWLGKKAPNGYGVFGHKGACLLAHRVSFEFYVHREPIGVVRHTCDNRLCVNPSHLLEGTQKDNADDCRSRGRALKAKGLDSGRGVLSDQDILDIQSRRRQGETCRAIARDYPVRENQISRVTTGARRQTVKEKQTMTPQRYVDLAMRTNKDMGKKDNTMHAAMLLASESGEVMSEVKRMFAYGKDLDVHNIKEELGDLMWGIALMCSTLGFSLESVLEGNIAKLAARYPDGYSDIAATQRDLFAEKEAMTKCETDKSS